VDATDLSIYRYLSPDGEIRFWGSRRLLDFRVTSREVARKVGLSEAGVRVRLKALERRGLLGRRELGVNPALFGASLVVSEIPVRDPREAARLIRELALVDGVTFARDVLDEGNRSIRVFHVDDSPTATARRGALLRKLAPDGEVSGPVPYWLPECERELTPLDWKLVRVLRAHPDAGVGEIARLAGVSLKTATRRTHALLDSHAVWYAVGGASEEPPLALVTVRLDDRHDRALAARAIAAVDPRWIPVATDGFGVAPADARSWVVGLVPAEAPSSLERNLRKWLSLDGVVAVRRTFGLGSASFPEWVDEAIGRNSPPPA
jgi:DNA-binding Lrp family transcriptional regulator